MIINYPTGFYKSILPPAPESKGNITYTISNEVPPRGSLFFLKNNLRLASTSLPLLTTEPTGVRYNGTVKSYRGITSSSVPIRPIGSVIEFNDNLNPIDNVNQNLNSSNDFYRFNNSSIDPINSKLIDAYKKFQQRLIDISQELQNSYVSIGNFEREYNTYVSSLNAIDQALILEPDDQSLLGAKQELTIKADINSTITKSLYVTVNTLSTKKLQYEDSLRSLSKAIK